MQTFHKNCFSLQSKQGRKPDRFPASHDRKIDYLKRQIEDAKESLKREK